MAPRNATDSVPFSCGNQSHQSMIKETRGLAAAFPVTADCLLGGGPTENMGLQPTFSQCHDTTIHFLMRVATSGARICMQLGHGGGIPPRVLGFYDVFGGWLQRVEPRNHMATLAVAPQGAVQGSSLYQRKEIRARNTFQASVTPRASDENLSGQTGIDSRGSQGTTVVSHTRIGSTQLPASRQ